MVGDANIVSLCLTLIQRCKSCGDVGLSIPSPGEPCDMLELFGPAVEAVEEEVTALSI